MKKLFFFLAIIPSLMFAQDIGVLNLTVSQINSNQVNIYLKTVGGKAFVYNANQLNLTNNIINLNVCYDIDFSDIYMTDEQNFTATIPTNSNYTLNIKLFKLNSATPCDYSILEDEATLNFTFPLTSPISLIGSNFENFKTNFKLFPNPVQDYFILSYSQNIQEDFDYKIFDLTGRIVQFGISSNNEKINTKLLSIGNYIVQIKDIGGNFINKKMAKN